MESIKRSTLSTLFYSLPFRKHPGNSQSRKSIDNRWHRRRRKQMPHAEIVHSKSEQANSVKTTRPAAAAVQSSNKKNKSSASGE